MNNTTSKSLKDLTKEYLHCNDKYKGLSEIEKEKLITDLYSRLKYGIYIKLCKIPDINKFKGDIPVNEGILGGYHKSNFQDYTIEEVIDSINNGAILKPYLRPMSSMTENEAKEYFKNAEYEFNECYEASANCESIITRAILNAEESCINIDWLNSKGFDYRGLIPAGLALEAKIGMYN